MPATKLCLGAASICEMLYLHASHDFGIALPFSGYDIMLLNSKAKQGIQGFKIRQCVTTNNIYIALQGKGQTWATLPQKQNEQCCI